MARRLLLPAALLAAAFTVGALMAKYHLFPYGTMKWIQATVLGAPEDEGERQGAWYPAPATGSPNELSEDMRAQLAQFPYGRGAESQATEVASVTRIADDLVYHGLNLVVSGHAAEAFLTDMKGRILHSWRKDLEDIWPGPLGFAEYEVHKQFWRRAFAYPNGDLLAIFEGIGIVKLDRDSNLLWENKNRAHHDLFVADDGHIHVLSRHLVEKHPRYRGAVLEDFVATLGPDGEELQRISVLEAFWNSDYNGALTLAAKKGDILHTNTVERMDGRFAERHPLYHEGHFLLSVPSLNTIAVLDPVAKTIVWALGGLWTFQHQPTVLDDGRMLVFDNRGESGKSRVLEIDPLTQEIAWAYRHTEEQPFFSAVIGSSQRLPNGNTLITESTKGRAFEVTRAGELAWEFYNPKRAGDNDEMIACLYELVRLAPDYFDADFSKVLAVVPDREVELPGIEKLLENGGEGERPK